MAQADTPRVQKRIIELLNARPNDNQYLNAVNAENGTFQFDEEIFDAMIQADGMIVVEGYLSQVGHSMRSRFMTANNIGISGDIIPEHIGHRGSVELSIDGGANYTEALECQSLDDVTQASKLGNWVSTDANAFEGFFFIRDNELHFSAGIARIWLPIYTRQLILQAEDAHEPAIIAGTMSILKKDGSNAEHDYYNRQFYTQLQMIQQGSMNLSDFNAYEGT